MFQFIYSQLIRLLLPFILIRLWLQGRQSPALRKDWRHRLGLVPALSGPVIWVHAVSVGETIAAAPMIRRLLARNLGATLLITAMTDTGLAQARRMFGDSVAYAYVPYDTPGGIRRFLNRVNPNILVIMETEIWPNMIRQCRARQVPVFLINARLSERSAQGYERVQGIVAPIFRSLAWVAAQAEPDAERFRRIGVPTDRVEVTGSVKFDVDIPAEVHREAEAFRAVLGNRPVWIAGSTHQGEDDQLLAAHRQLLAKYPDALLILVPRHPDRFDAVAQQISATGLALSRRSQGESLAGVQVYLADTMGELMMLYGASDVAFVGGSLIERGGHNPLEPAAWGIPVLSGPHVFNFETIYERMLVGRGAQLVRDSGQLGNTLTTLFGEAEQRKAFGERALAVVTANRGALDKVVEGIVERL